MKKSLLNSITSLALVVAMITCMTSLASAANVSPSSSEMNRLRAEVATAIEKDGGIPVATVELREGEWYSHTLINRNEDHIDSDVSWQQHSCGYVVPNDMGGATLKIAWAAGGDQWQATQSTLKAYTDSGQFVYLPALGASAGATTYTFDGGTVPSGGGTLYIKPYSQCHGTYSILYTLYIIKEF